MDAPSTTNPESRKAMTSGAKRQAAGGAKVGTARRKATARAAREGPRKRTQATGPSLKRKTEATEGKSGRPAAKRAAKRWPKRVAKVGGGRGAVGGGSPEKPASNRGATAAERSAGARVVKRKSRRAAVAKGRSVKTKASMNLSVKATASKVKTGKAVRSGRRVVSSRPGPVAAQGRQKKSRPRRSSDSPTQEKPKSASRAIRQDRSGRSKMASGGGKGRRSPALPAGLLSSCFVGLRRRRPPDGLGVMVGIVETVGGQIDATVIACDRSGNLGPRPGATGTSSITPARLGGSGPKSIRHLSTALAAMGHPVRIKILTMLLDGPGVYRSLQKVTGLKPGPLYHHVNQLRLAGLIGPKERDLYELTRAGRNLLMVTLAVEPLLKDSRLRPQATG